MEHTHTPHEPTQMEAPHPHEAPGAPFVDPHVFASIRSLLRAPLADRAKTGTPSGEETLRVVEQHFTQLDWLADLARRSIQGEHDAAALLLTWLETNGRERRDADDVHEHRARATIEDVADGHGEPPVERELGRSLGLNVRAIRELFLGAVYAAGPDRELRDRNVDTIRTTVMRSVGLLDAVHYHAVRALDGFEHQETLSNLLEQLPQGKELTSFLRGHPLAEQPKLPPLLEINPILECLDVLRQGTVGTGSAFGQLEEVRSDALNLTARIVRVSPADVCGGAVVTLHADPANKFPATRPSDYGVFVEPCGLPARIDRWSEDEVRIEIPERATSGCITLGRAVASETVGEARLAEQQSVQTFAACMGQFGIGVPGLGSVSLDPTTFCRVTACPAGSPNFLRVRHKAVIVSLVARDPAGHAIGSDGVEAGTPVTVSWAVTSDDGGQPQISVTGAKNVSGLPAVGSLALAAQDTRVAQSLTLEAVNSCGTTTSAVTIDVFRMLYLSPRPLSFLISASGVLTIRSSCPVPTDVTVSLAASSPGRVTLPANATIAAGQDRVSVVVSPSLSGGTAAYVNSLKQSEPAAVVNASAAGHTAGAAEVWVEPELGQAKVVSPTNTDVVAVHMALLRTGNVLLFSADDTDFGNIDKVKTRVWNPLTNTVVTPSFPFTTHKNLFCAGHCLLPDGRVLVIGGHAIFAGGSAAKMAHTYDPAANSWSRHGQMQKDRWYPTCVTLADGRALIASGSEAGGPPTIFKGVVRDDEIFDPATSGLTRFANVHGDICMYPFMFVLPGGTLLFHSRNVSWLFAPGTGTWSPTNGTWSGDIPMKNPTTRTYPGMAGCALLPLLPDEDYAVRILMAGGGGARECDLHASTTATRTAEILDVDVSANSGTWRDTNGAGTKLMMTTPRFMTDAVLLPDGTVLLVNGAAAGKADDSHVSVGFAELFDPQTETFRPMTNVSIPRHYHGTALLLPDGRVAVAGHTKEFNKPPVELNRPEIELISPPYLFRGPRPQITQLTYSGARIGYGQSVTISSNRASDIARVALLRAGSVTHQLNTDQRYVGLAISQRSSGSLIVTAPTDGGVAPPGYYMLFIVDGRGVPSQGRFVPVG
jgi:hypothetical protein